MYLIRELITEWAARQRAGTVLVKLNSDDTMDGFQPTRPFQFHGPSIVELVVHRDGLWSARELEYETPHTIYQQATS